MNIILKLKKGSDENQLRNFRDDFGELRNLVKTVTKFKSKINLVIDYSWNFLSPQKYMLLSWTIFLEKMSPFFSTEKT